MNKNCILTMSIVGMFVAHSSQPYSTVTTQNLSTRLIPIQIRIKLGLPCTVKKGLESQKVGKKIANRLYLY